MESLFPVVILAGGLSRRLRPITTHVAKALVDINGEPFIEHQLRLLHRQGARSVLICIGYLGKQIQDYVGNGERFGLQIQYSSDAPNLLGTAGAIKKALSLINKDVFFVMYGDSYLTCHYRVIQQKFISDHPAGLMTVFKNDDRWDKSNVEFNDGKIIRYDKENYHERMKYIDYGLSIFHKKAFLNIPHDQYCDLTELYQSLLSMGQLSAYEVFERFYEIGSFKGKEEFAEYIKSN